MKNIKKVVAAGLVLSMAMSMAGCMGGGKLAPSKLAAAAKKNGCELIKDPDDFEDEMEEDEVEDGIYITVVLRISLRIIVLQGMFMISLLRLQLLFTSLVMTVIPVLS